MTYFATELEDAEGNLGETFSFTDFLWQMRLRNKPVAGDSLITWLKNNAPGTIMVLAHVERFKRVREDDGAIHFYGIHPELDGLTHEDILAALQARALSNLAVKSLSVTLWCGQEFENDTEGSVKSKQWVAKMSDVAATAYKLHKPDAKPIELNIGQRVLA